MKKKSKQYQYGRDPAPTNWFEASDALRTLTKPTRKPNQLSKKLDSIEQLLKDHK